MSDDGARARRVLLLGNEACAEGAIAAGVRFYAGYPITPATEIFERFAYRLPGLGGVCVQMEDECGSMHALLGAAAAGQRVATATSGPGFTLVQEGIASLASAELPAIVINVQRIGPSTGSIYGAQMDVMQAQWGFNANHASIVLAPASVSDCFWVTVRAVELAERLRMPVIVMSEMHVGLMRQVMELPDYDTIRVEGRLRPTCSPSEYRTYHCDHLEDVPPLADIGTGYRNVFQVTTHGPEGIGGGGMVWDYKEADWHVRHLAAKVLHRGREIEWVESFQTDDADTVIVAYGSCVYAAVAAMEEARRRGRRVGVLKLVSLWPFPEEALRTHTRNAETVLVPELNLGQMVREVERTLGPRGVVVQPVNRVDSYPMCPEDILTALDAPVGRAR
ncbi:MAG: 2-oxoacid:acceptor oxidoreductase subunit alpha [Candidatus Rokubacteria bacterium]|nr:2-oxoacid:acceptor oxidoreductase subunit alpha [Candidatus Rokubacteria bacterium]